jgi:eukaryotic-like serine/threonine-protein kinase
VWKAFDRQIGRQVAIKVVPVPGSGGKGPSDYRQEAELLSKLNHPAIIPILDVVDSGSAIALVMPFVSGRVLSDGLRPCGRMDSRQAAELVADLADALHLLHVQGSIHGDLKPSNILMGDDGRPRLLGLEVKAGSPAPLPAGSIVCTPAYAPPEQIEQTGQGRDPRVDVYSLGVILYEVLTGKRPFEGRTIQEVFQKVLDHKPTPPRQLVRKIPAEMEAICLKAMARNPEDRYATAAELAEALRQFRKPKARKGFWK